MSEQLELLDWKRRVFALYESVRADPEPERAWTRWREVRDELFRTHPQTPLPSPSSFGGLAYFAYEPAWRVEAEVEPAEPVRREIATSGEEPYAFTRFARARFAAAGGEHALELFWLEGYPAGSSSRSRTRRAARRPTAPGATCWTR